MSGMLNQRTESQISRCLKTALEQNSPDESDYPYTSYPSDLLPDAPRPAAVLIPLLKVQGAWHVLFTRRTSNLAEHSGQVAFPGGRADPDDPDRTATALREAWEEIGLEPADVRVLGQLNDFLTITNYCVTPVVGVIPWPYPLRIAPEEVSRVFTIPLGWLANPVNYEERLHSLPAPFGALSVIYYHPFDGEVLWGASARLTLTFIKIISCAQ